MIIVLRSIVFNVLFYAVLTVYLIAAIPVLLLNRKSMIRMTQSWARTSLWLMRVICDLKFEFAGVEKMPKGPLVCAAKHQSIWETFALLTLFDDPAYILKRELMWIPFYGWCARKAGMIPVDRGARSQALSAMTARAKIEMQRERQLIIFPEGTRRPPGGEPKYKFGVAHLYTELGVPCLPVALNSGLYWPRRAFLRYPGTIRVELLDPIAPGLDKQAFFTRLQDDIETATARLVEQGRAELAAIGVPAR